MGECMYSGGQIIVGKGSQLVLGANEFYGEYYFVFFKIFLLVVDSECLFIGYSGCHMLFCIFQQSLYQNMSLCLARDGKCLSLFL